MSQALEGPGAVEGCGGVWRLGVVLVVLVLLAMELTANRASVFHFIYLLGASLSEA